ncbi:MAG: 23S rRNA (guanosine(2251)-2'-O)-methyltransferase RlmB, partial [Actinomycetota bacterium]|nr:23S rRNA (guanosine(2251)-2'-O)-methyltransferase RlmB [Actinomycetota bacterium]
DGAPGRPGRSRAGAPGDRRARSGPPQGSRGAAFGRPSPSPQPPGRSGSGGPRGLGGEQVEGRQAVRELLLAGRRRVRDVWLADDLDDAPILAEIKELATEARVRMRPVRATALSAEARSEAPQGVLAHAEPLPEADFDELVSTGRGPWAAPFLVFLDGITDPQNLGALLRSAEGAGVSGVVLPRHRAAHVTPTVAKAAAGAVEHLPMALVGGLPTALARAREAGVWTVGLDSGGESSLFDLTLASEPVALVLGAEGRGLGRLVRQRCDVVASIPLRGALGSLNVAAAGALACFEVARRRSA